ncbi:DUF3267 domain-containing protein [Candidatus Dependentiae bacterium]|nr:DUF3267 domain-containing protein [Candidatus Dependentiae bacterium]
MGIFLIYYFLIYIPAHEIIHVLAAHMFRSGKAKFGFKFVHKVMPVVYVHLRGHYKISQLRLVYLMPLLALNFIPLCLFILDRNLLTFIYFSFFFNILGASGDLYIFYKSLKYSGKLKAVDLSDDIGFEILD